MVLGAGGESDEWVMGEAGQRWFQGLTGVGFRTSPSFPFYAAHRPFHPNTAIAMKHCSLLSSLCTTWDVTAPMPKPMAVWGQSRKRRLAFSS